MQLPDFLVPVLFPLLLLASTSSLHAAELKDSLAVVGATNSGAAKSQQKIDALSRETRVLLEEYRQLRDNAEYQDAHTRELELLDTSQKERIDSLKRQIAQARITRQRILPLMRSMADALEKFVVLDIPFHQEERIAAVLQLKQRLDRPGLSVSARFRLLLEAYQLEQNYGSTVEAWRAPLQLEQESLSVEYLRLGRVALFYQSLDREKSGYWDVQEQTWVQLDEGHKRALSQAMRVAKNQAAPQLLQLPLLPPGGDT